MSDAGVSMTDSFRGFATSYVRILNITPPQSETIDRFGKIRMVPVSVQRTGLRPQVGEFWLIDHFYGTWTYAARIDVEMCPLWVEGVVQSVGAETAVVRDEFDRDLEVTMALDRVGTFEQSENTSADSGADLVLPSIGESWVIDCIYGEWSFAARKTP